MTTRILAAASLAALVVIGAGCGFFRDAEISYMAPGGNIHDASLECWMEITFTGEPPGDPRDVEVVFSSVAMPGPQSFDWSFIADHDLVRRGEWQGYAVNADTSADVVPPRETAIRVNFPLQSYDRFQLEAGDKLQLQATLYWGGVKQHSLSRTLGHVFAGEGEAF